MSEQRNKHAVALGRIGGKSRSRAKIAAARANGSKGGRPKNKHAYKSRRKTIRKACC